MADRWHILRDGPRLTHARHLPPRFDVAVRTRLPSARPGRIAAQIRQDMWRALRRQRGFSPVVEVEATEEGLVVRAGGRVMVDGVDHAQLAARIGAVLEDVSNRARWVRAGRGGRS